MTAAVYTAEEQAVLDVLTWLGQDCGVCAGPAYQGAPPREAYLNQDNGLACVECVESDSIFQCNDCDLLFHEMWLTHNDRWPMALLCDECDLHREEALSGGDA